MSTMELEHLERDVEQARGRVAADLAVLRSPGAFSELKNELRSEIRGTKEAYVARGRDAASGFLDEIKARVAANPLAVLAIGTGLAWRLARHPPIASVLLGYGLVSLFRTDPQEPGFGSEYVDRAAQLAGSAKERLQDWQGASVNGGTSAASEPGMAETAKERLADWSNEARATAQNVAAQTRQTAERLTESGRDLVSRAMQHEDRDKYLLGAAGLALATAVGIAYQRRASHGNGHEDGDRLPYRSGPAPSPGEPYRGAPYRSGRLIYRDGRWIERH